MVLPTSFTSSLSRPVNTWLQCSPFCMSRTTGLEMQILHSHDPSHKWQLPACEGLLFTSYHLAEALFESWVNPCKVLLIVGHVMRRVACYTA